MKDTAMQIHEQVEQELRKGARTIPELSIFTDLTERQCRNAVARLQREGRVKPSHHAKQTHSARSRMPFTVYQAVRHRSTEPNVSPPKDYAEPTSTHQMPLHVCDAGPIRRLWNKIVDRLSKPMELP